MRKSLFWTIALAFGTLFPASASDFFNSGNPANLFNLGVRLGVNTSNKNIDNMVFDTWNTNSWGTGVDVGVVADINFKDFISVQPGIFFESRSGKYSYVSQAKVVSVPAEGGDTEHSIQYLTQFGNMRSYNFIIPIMGCVHFNLSNDIRWNVEFGPYFQIVLKNNIKGNVKYPLYSGADPMPISYAEVVPTKFDFGLKFGTSLKVLDHYVVGVHYEAGCLKPWTNSQLGGRRKAWVFSLGYDF